MDYIIRKLEKEEVKVLDTFLYEAIFIPEGAEAPNRDIINLPELQVYIDDFGTVRYNSNLKGILLLKQDSYEKLESEKVVIKMDFRIEQVLKNTDGVSEVHVSYSKGQAEIAYDPRILTRERIVSVIQELDYTVVDTMQNDYVKRNRVIGIVAVIILLYYIIQHFGILNLLVPSRLADSKMSYGMLFIVGLLTSVHCIAMCGGINLSQCIPLAALGDESNTKSGIIMPAFLYNAGRVISYSAIGFVLGGIKQLTDHPFTNRIKKHIILL